jgi:hypothetical protein
MGLILYLDQRQKKYLHKLLNFSFRMFTMGIFKRDQEHLRLLFQQKKSL